jgi:predicted RNA-binding protein
MKIIIELTKEDIRKAIEDYVQNELKSDELNFIDILKDDKEVELLNVEKISLIVEKT